jgi:glucose-1-phosphate adenylyltransferase
MASMGIYAFSADYLLSCLDADSRDSDSRHDFGYSIMPRIVGDADVYVTPFRNRDGKPAYWRDVGCVDSYWLAHMELLDGTMPGAGMRRPWPLLGAPRSESPARLTSSASVRNSVVAADTYVAGSVLHSVVSTGCQVERGASVIDSVLLPGATVGANCILNRVVVDSRCHIPDGAVIDADYLDDGGDFYIAPNGVVLVTSENLKFELAHPAHLTA